MTYSDNHCMLNCWSWLNISRLISESKRVLNWNTWTSTNSPPLTCLQQYLIEPYDMLPKGTPKISTFGKYLTLKIRETASFRLVKSSNIVSPILQNWNHGYFNSCNILNFDQIYFKQQFNKTHFYHREHFHNTSTSHTILFLKKKLHITFFWYLQHYINYLVPTILLY